MGRTHKPRKPYRPRTTGQFRFRFPQLWQIEATFSPIESMLQHILRTGTLDASEDGKLCFFYALHDKAYDAVHLLESYCAVFDIARVRDPAFPSCAPLLVVAQRMAKEQVNEAEIAAALRCILDLRDYSKRIPLQEFAEILRSAEIKLEWTELDDERAQH